MSQEQVRHPSSLQQPTLKQPPFKIGTFRTYPLNPIPLPPLLKSNHNSQYGTIKSKLSIEPRK
jgi:hypothetical protein